MYVFWGESFVKVYKCTTINRYKQTLHSGLRSIEYSLVGYMLNSLADLGVYPYDNGEKLKLRLFYSPDGARFDKKPMHQKNNTPI